MQCDRVPEFVLCGVYSKIELDDTRGGRQKFIQIYLQSFRLIYQDLNIGNMDCAGRVEPQLTKLITWLRSDD